MHFLYSMIWKIYDRKDVEMKDGRREHGSGEIAFGNILS